MSLLERSREELEDRAIGCLLAGAYCDSATAQMEFSTAIEIAELFDGSILEPLGFENRGKGTVSDDTQQVVFVCRGLVRGFEHGRGGSLVEDVWLQLREWRYFQFNPWHHRAPGGTSLSALSRETPGTIAVPINDSTSCGAVMRAHSIGLAFTGDPSSAFDIGVEIGALTHGNPDGYTPSGALAAIVAQLLIGQSLVAAIQKVLLLCEERVPTARATARLLHLVLQSNGNPSLSIDLGINAEGWEGPEALAMALHAALRFPGDLNMCCYFAAAHNGDSDSVASIAGALLGAQRGERIIPRPWNTELEYGEELRQRAYELIRASLVAEVRPATTI